MASEKYSNVLATRSSLLERSHNCNAASELDLCVKNVPKASNRGALRLQVCQSNTFAIIHPNQSLLFFRADRRCAMISALEGMGFCHTQSAPASVNSSFKSFPEHPMMMDSILIRRMAYTTSVPTMTPPASSMNWSTVRI